MSVLFQILSFHFSLPYTENTSQVQPHQVAEREGMGPSRWTLLASQRSDCRWPGHVIGAAGRLGVDPVALQGPCSGSCKGWVSRQPLPGTGKVGPASHTPEPELKTDGSVIQAGRGLAGSCPYSLWGGPLALLQEGPGGLSERPGGWAAGLGELSPCMWTPAWCCT